MTLEAKGTTAMLENLKMSLAIAVGVFLGSIAWEIIKPLFLAVFQ